MAKDWLQRIFVVAGLGCAPEVEPPLQCTDEGPMVLLELGEADGEPERVLYSNRDDRGWLVVVEDRGLALECDAPPREFVKGIADGLVRLSDPELPWLAYRPRPETVEGLQWLAVDPWDRGTLGSLPGILMGSFDGALVSVLEDGDPESVWLTELSSDRRPVTVELPFAPASADLSIFRWARPWSNNPLGTTDAVFGLVRDFYTGQRDAVAIDLVGGEVNVLQSDVEDIHVHGDGRFVVVVPSGQSEPAVLIDRETGQRLPAGEAAWSFSRSLEGPRLVLFTGASVNDERTHIVFLPGLEEAWLEGIFDTPASWVADDGRRVLQGDDGISVIAPGDTVETLLYPGRGSACVVGDAVILWDGGLMYEQPGGPYERIVRIPLDGSPSETIIDGPVTWAAPLVDGRWAVQRHYEGAGDLLIYDPAAHDETLLARDTEYPFQIDRPPQTWEDCPLSVTADRPTDEIRWVAIDPDDGTRKLWRYAIRHP